jgi:anti-sigma B factor antagonist
LLNLTDTTEAGQARVVATGELDMYTAPDLSDVLDKLMDGGATEIVIDLSGIEFMDSTGLSAILGAHQRLDQSGGKLVLDHPSASITRMFDITGLADHFVVRFPKS